MTDTFEEEGDGEKSTGLRKSHPTSEDGAHSPMSPQSPKYAEIAVFGSTAEADDAEYEAEMANRARCCGLLHPETSISMVYDSWQMICLIYLLLVLPWRIAFEEVPKSGEISLYMDIIVDLSLGGDIFLNLQRFFYHKRTGLLITDQVIIRRKYLTSWFFIDTISIIPFDWVIFS